MQPWYFIFLTSSLLKSICPLESDTCCWNWGWLPRPLADPAFVPLAVLDSPPEDDCSFRLLLLVAFPCTGLSSVEVKLYNRFWKKIAICACKTALLLDYVCMKIWLTDMILLNFNFSLFLNKSSVLNFNFRGKIFTKHAQIRFSEIFAISESGTCMLARCDQCWANV